MKQTFGDTFFYLALLNPRDASHEKAVALNGTRAGGIVTTHWVLTELGDALAAPQDRRRFLRLVETLEADPDVLVISADEGLFQRGTEFFRRRPDKDWPLTDCFSFVVMHELGISDALTGDVHFRQAGFNALFLTD